MKRKVMFGTLLFVLVFSLALVACGDNNNQQPTPPPTGPASCSAIPFF